jgi:hypothetical protein
MSTYMSTYVLPVLCWQCLYALIIYSNYVAVFNQKNGDQLQGQTRLVYIIETRILLPYTAVTNTKTKCRLANSASAA